MDKLSKEEWVAQVARSFARNIPDEFPEGFAYHLAKQYAEDGEYEKYLADEFPEGMLYVPSS